ncbi:MAG TPA: Dabb family protein [Pontiellaceae bacterium]|nr:Dabb family protein [Pontiellaceae bacterium]HPR83725.1 Dabb family protein [Pontiellaceae bacterium]
MVKHIVVWQMRESVSAEQKIEMKRRLETLVLRIPRVLKIEAGIDSGGGTMSLYSEFTSRDALAAYQTHPAHQEVVAFVKKLVTARSVCDYEC